jgi:outer membrane protein TolC
MKGEFSVTQNLWPTGGTLSLETSLDYIKQLDGNKFREFMSVPFAVTLNQPLFGVNTVKWDRRIEPVKYEEAKAGFLSATEEVTMNTIQYFFNLLLAKENLNITRQNLRNAKKLYEVAQAKRKMGQISENDMLQLKLNLLKAQSKLTDNESSLKSNMFKMRSFLGMDDDTELVPVIPNNTSSLFLKYKDVLQKALLNNSFSKNILRREMQADYDVAKARGNLRNISLYAQLGYTGVNKDLGSAYDHLNGNQVVEIGVKIPLLDWGKRRGQVKVAESNREVIESKIKQEKMNFNQNLFILVEEFNNQLSQLNIAKESDKIAERRYDTNVKTFMVGKISTLDLNDSQSSKDEARQKYINELFYYWYYYYQVRSLTLWDFEHDTNIDADFDKIVKN